MAEQYGIGIPFVKWLQSPILTNLTLTNSLYLPAITAGGGLLNGIYEGVSTLIRTFWPVGANGYNVFIGGGGNLTLAGAGEQASRNVCIGVAAGMSLTTGYRNYFSGYQTGALTTTGYCNVGISDQTLLSNTTGWGNIAIGGISAGNDAALFSNVGGHDNIAIGRASLHTNVEGSGNIAIGIGAAGLLGTLGSSQHNIAIGVGAMHNGVTNEACIAIGLNAGYYETGDNKLFIDSSTDGRTNEATARITSLIYGIFAAATVNQWLYINGHLVLLLSEVPTGANNAAAAAAGIPVGGLYRANADPSILYIRSA